MGVLVSSRGVNYIQLDETVFIDIGFNDTDGSGSNGTSPIVRFVDCTDVESGLGAASPVVFSVAPTVLTALKQQDGTTTALGALLVVAPFTAANGFEAHKTYVAWLFGTLGARTPTASLGIYKT